MISLLLVFLWLAICIGGALALGYLIENGHDGFAYLVCMSPLFVGLLYLLHLVSSEIVCARWPYLSECIK